MQIQQLLFLKVFGLLGTVRAWGFSDFLILIGVLIGIVVLLIGMVLFVIHTIKSVIKRQEKAKLMEEKVLPELISKFGKVLSTEAVNYNRSARFERHETLFELKVTPTHDSEGQLIGTVNKVEFKLPNLREKFYIRHKSFFAAKTLGGCQSVQVTMPKDFIFYSLNPQFLLSLMEKEKIRSEIYKYQKKVSQQFSVAFENGVMTIIWHRDLNYEITWETRMIGGTTQTEEQGLEQICQTAAVFFDELAKK